MEKKQSSLDYLIEQLFKTRNNSTEVKETNSESIFNQAKAMHKEEVKESYREGRSDQQSPRNVSFYHRNAESYFNETFGGEK